MERRRMRTPRWVQLGLFPLLMLGAVSGGVFAYAPGREPWLIPLIVGAVYATAIAIERAYPFAPAWNRPWKESRDDGLYFLLGQPVVLLAEIAAVTVAAWAAIALGAHLENGWWWSDGPFLLQLALALLIADFLPYWYHRLSHESSGLLWRIHAVHHAPERLYSLNFIRMHPLNLLASRFLALLPLAVLGVPAPVLMSVAIVQKAHSLLSHANIDFRLGPLNWIFSMAELHRLHHARAMHVANGNYGSTLIAWDIVFGTRINEPKATPALELGISNPQEVPAGVCRQVIQVFRCC